MIPGASPAVSTRVSRGDLAAFSSGRWQAASRRGDARKLVRIVDGSIWIVQQRTSDRIIDGCTARLAEPDEEPVVCTGLEVRVVRHPRGWGWWCRDCDRTRWHIVGPRGAARVARVEVAA